MLIKKVDSQNCLVSRVLSSNEDKYLYISELSDLGEYALRHSYLYQTDNPDQLVLILSNGDFIEFIEN